MSGPTTRSEARADTAYLTVLASLGEGVIVESLAAGVTLSNPAALRLLGLSEDELHGRVPLDRRWRAVHADGREWPRPSHPAVVTLTTGEPVTGAVMGVHRPDGSLVWLSVTTRLVPGEPAEERRAVVALADITEQRLLTEALARREAEYRLVAEGSDDVVLRHGLPDGRIVWASPNTARLLGVAPDELVGQLVSERLAHPDDRPKVQAAAEVARTSGQLAVTYRLLGPEGAERWVEARGAAHRDPDSGAFTELVSTLRDVTERVEAERRLAESAELYRAVVGSLPSTTLLVIDDRLVCRFSDGARLAGTIDPRLLLGRSVEDVLRPQMAAEVVPNLRRALAGEPVAWDLAGQFATHHAVQAVPLGTNGDRALVVVQEITARKLTEGALASSEELLRTSLEAFDAAFARFAAVRDPVSGELTDFRLLVCNAAAREFTARHEVALEVGGGMRALPQLGEERFRFYRGVVESGSAVTTMVDLSDRGGGKVEVRAVPAGDGVLVVGRDVTLLLAAEDRRREAERQFRVAFDGAPIGVQLVALDGTILQANRALHVLLGYPDGALNGRTMADITPPEELIRAVAVLRDLASGVTEVGDRDERCLRADGTTVWASVHTSVVRDSVGRASYFISHVKDITDRRSFEARLRYLAERDPLTGLYNRRSLQPALDAALGAVPGDPSGAVLVIDLDGFKSINDTLGHAAGDRVLAAAAGVLSASVRTADVVARLGGDEFVVFLPRAAEPVARRVAALMLSRLAALGDDGGLTRVTASIGIAVTDDLREVDELLRRADSAMYTAKRNGRSRAELAGGPESADAPTTAA